MSLTDLFNLLLQDVRIDKKLQAGLRVTVQLNKTQIQGIFVHQVFFVFFVFFLPF